MQITKKDHYVACRVQRFSLVDKDQNRPWREYRMGTNFWGWLYFAVFKGTSQTVKDNPSKILWGCAHARTRAIAGKDKLENGAIFITFIQLLKRNSVCCFSLPSLVHWSTSTITPLIQKGHGNYTRNKSAKVKTFENLRWRLPVWLNNCSQNTYNPYDKSKHTRAS